jgi:ankyrin repeat protein
MSEEEFGENEIKLKRQREFDNDDLELSEDDNYKSRKIEHSPQHKSKFYSPESKRQEYEEEKVFDADFIGEFDIFSLARHSRAVELENLLLKGVDPDSKDNNGNTILLVAAQNGNKRIAKLALRYGAQINMFNTMGNTALHFCYEYNYIELADYLISKGANLNIKNIRDLRAVEGIRLKTNPSNKLSQSGGTKISKFRMTTDSNASKFGLQFLKNTQIQNNLINKQKDKQTVKKLNII